MTQTTTHDTAATFLDLCAAIESALRDRHGLDRVHGLRDVVHEASVAGDVSVTYYREHLLGLAELHGVVLRSRDGSGAHVAPPLPDTIARAERIAQEITQPTPALRFASSAMSRAASSDALGPRLAEMRRRDFSQVPVYDGGVFAGLLTTNAVARWLADQLDERGDAIVEDVHVRDVLPYVEEHEVAWFVPQHTPACEVVSVLLGERPPLAVILTASGRDTEPPLGLVVAADLPELLAALAV